MRDIKECKQAFEETKGIYIDYRGMSEEQKAKLEGVIMTVDLMRPKKNETA